MKKGYLSQIFKDIAIKRLSRVEINTSYSNQHELNGSKPLKNLLGENKLTDYPVSFVWLGGENDFINDKGSVTWYDARANHPNRTEFRLYFKRNLVMDVANEGDLLIIARKSDGEIFIFIIQERSTLESQLLWLFGITDEIGSKFNYQAVEDGYDPKINYAIRYIIEEIGLEIVENDTEKYDNIIAPFIESGFPSTKDFSALARNTITGVSPHEDPDMTLIKWMEHEEILFKRLENHFVKKQLEKGFYDNDKIDVDGFIKYSLSVHNRRKARVGYALENHLQEIFTIHDVSYSYNKITEHKSKPDFIFPTIDLYHNRDFPVSKLTMLGVKSTCKDRWRQVLSEAKRIKTKHLFTLEPGISEYQTNEMQENNLQLVLPITLHDTYHSNQRKWLMSLQEFIDHVIKRQQ